MRSLIAVAATFGSVVSAIVVGVAVPAGAATPTCSASGNAYPQITSIERTSPEVTTHGREVVTAVQVVGGDAPVTIYVNYVHEDADPLDPGPAAITNGIVSTEGLATARGLVPSELGGTTTMLNATAIDGSGCTSTYYATTIEYLNLAGSQTYTHSLGTEALGFDIVAPSDAAPVRDDWTQSQVYMNALTQQFLNRDATGAEMSSASEQLTELGRLGVARQMADTEEWAGEVVDDIYQAALDRDPDDGGRVYWVDRLHTSGRTRDIAISVYGSNEALAAAGGDPGTFVDGLYNRILGRDAEVLARAFWVIQFETGAVEPWQMVAAFWESPEFRAQRVNQVYQSVLGRDADSAGRTYWADRLQTEDDVELAALLASSDEFYNAAIAAG